MKRHQGLDTIREPQEMDGEPVSLSDSSSGSNWSENEGKKRLRGKKRKTQSFKNKKHSFKRRCKSESPNSRQSMGQQMTNNSQIPVTCGKKEGLLDLDKWKNKMEDCILSEDKWYKPSEFEIYGGKEKMKKWKTSIFYQGVTLQKLIEDKLLLSPVFKRRRTQNEQRKSSPVADRPSGCELPGDSPDGSQILLVQTETMVSVESETIDKPNFTDEEPPPAELSDFKMVQISLGAESSVQVANSEGVKCEPEPEEQWITETTEKNIPVQEHTQEQLFQQCQSASIVPAPTIARKLQEVLEMQVEVLELKKRKLQLEIEQIKKEMGNQ